MKENKYDDELFYEKYSRFPRSVKGLKAAGEWHELQKMLLLTEMKDELRWPSMLIISAKRK